MEHNTSIPAAAGAPARPQKFLYSRLAAGNLKKNSQTYIPYILTCIGTITLYYILNALARSDSLGGIADHQAMRFLLELGCWVIAIFSVIFLFYTNSFLVKRRKKEFGLFNILGMEKKHISRMVFMETLYVAGISFAAGLALGVLLGKAMQMLLFHLLHMGIKTGFEVSPGAMLQCLILFGIIFLLTFLNTLRQIHLSKPVELLHGGNVGEKEPKTKWLLAIVGVVLLAGGYAIAIRTTSPLDALALFFVAVILVILGTYCLFTAGSIAILKLLRRNKRYYYKANHFTAVSGMIYRMKQNAVGLANICILSTAVLVILSTTVSLYVGMNDVLHTRYPQDFAIQSSALSAGQVDRLNALVDDRLREAGYTATAKMQYRSQFYQTTQNGDTFSPDKDGSSVYFSDNRFSQVMCMTLDEYNRLMGESVTLAADEALVHTLKGSIPGDTLHMGGTTLRIKDRVDNLPIDGDQTAMMINSYYFIVSDDAVIKQLNAEFLAEGETDREMNYYYGFDLDAPAGEHVAFYEGLRQAIRADEALSSPYVECKEESRQGFYIVYGGLFFIGLFLGVIFIMATVLIIYYKQISEGYDDKRRFDIMQQVGMSHAEVRKSIRSQVLTVFFLPLIAAAVHILFAFNMISRLLFVLNLTNTGLFALCSVAVFIVFAVFYAIVYGITARTYYKIVS